MKNILSPDGTYLFNASLALRFSIQTATIFQVIASVINYLETNQKARKESDLDTIKKHGSFFVRFTTSVISSFVPFIGFDTVKDAVKKLISYGFIERENSLPRAYWLALTEKGRGYMC